ncbi:MAG: hypothetical protein GX462_05100, partial [Thermotogaceae bacterium]|nr:hypothetical protein [Thermotogaceae bacterium]
MIVMRRSFIRCFLCLVLIFSCTVVWALPDYYTLWVPVDAEAQGPAAYRPVATYDRYEPFEDLTWDHPLRIAVSSDPHFGRAESNAEATKSIIRSVNE